MDVNLNPIVYEVAKDSHSSAFETVLDDHGLPHQFLETSCIPGAWNVLDEYANPSDALAGYDDAFYGPRMDASSSIMSASEQKSDRSDHSDPFTAEEVFDLIRHINDPEHPLTLEQLRVAQLELIKVDNENSSVDIMFTPTIPHCSMALMIGLCLRVKLLRSLPKRFKVRVSITPGTHSQEAQITKQLNDKERVAAALENTKLLSVVDRCILTAADHAPGLDGIAIQSNGPRHPLAKNIAGTRDRPMIF